MTKHSIPFTLSAHIGDEEVEEALIGNIEVLIHSGDQGEEINCWRGEYGHLVDPYKFISGPRALKIVTRMEEMACQQAREIYRLSHT